MNYISIDMSQAKRLERILENVRDRAIGFAVKNTLNDLAFEARRNLVQKIDKDFVNRNTWTKRSIRVTRANYVGAGAEVGSIEKYMAKQEFGGKGEKYIATGNASGEGGRVKVRQRAVRQANWINKLQSAKLPPISGTPRRQGYVHLLMAHRRGLKYVVLENEEGQKGLYRVLGTKKKPRSKLLYMLERNRVPIKKHEWLKPTTQQTQKDKASTFYFIRLRQELNRAMRMG